MTSIHEYLYFIAPKANPSPIEEITGQVGIDEWIQDSHDLSLAIIDAVIADKKLECTRDDLRVVSLISLPEKDDE